MPADSPIFMLAERGDLSAIKEAFSRQLVTPNVYRDVGLDGYDHDLLTVRCFLRLENASLANEL